MTDSLPKGSWREFTTPFRRVTSPSLVPRLPKNGQEPFNVDLENRHTNKMSKDFSIDYYLTDCLVRHSITHLPKLLFNLLKQTVFAYSAGN